MVLAPGAFIALGFMIALFNHLTAGTYPRSRGIRILCCSTHVIAVATTITKATALCSITSLPENMLEYLSIVLTAILVNNIVFSQFLGICPFVGVSKNLGERKHHIVARGERLGAAQQDAVYHDERDEDAQG